MKTRWLVLLLLTFGSACHADRDIVYAARYYTPPGSHRTSHFHIYRINPDGTGKTQLTFGTDDDNGPKWSPDGRWITFTRQTALGHSALCLIRSTGGQVKKLSDAGLAGGFDDDYSCHWSPDGKAIAVVHMVFNKAVAYSVSLIRPQASRVMRRFVGASDFLWSPNGRWAYLINREGDKLLNMRTNAEMALKNYMASPVWLDNQTLVGLDCGDQEHGVFLHIFGVAGHEKQRITVKLPPSVPGMTGDGDSPQNRAADLLAPPPPLQTLVYAMSNHNSTVGRDFLFLILDDTTGRACYLTEGNFLAWSPNGSRFCTAPGRDTVFYAHRARGNDRTVWAAPLYIRAASGGKMRQLTPRLSWVTGADWRKGKP